jgi:hypothetical protein
MKSSLPFRLFGMLHDVRAKHALVIGFFGFGFAHSGFSDTVTYEFDLDQETQNATITGSDVDISASTFTVAGAGAYNGDWGYTNSAPTDSDSGANYLFIRGGAVTSSLDTSDYVSFTVTANTGSFDITGASLFARTGGSGQETNFALRSDVDSFTTDLFTGSSTATSSFDSFSTSTITGITGETSVEFRLYVWGSTENSDTHRYDDISVTVVPEPSTLALIGLAGVAALVGFRRKA